MRKASRDIQISIRVDPRVIERSDALVDQVSEELGTKATRTEVLRVALLRGLLSLERQK